MDLFDIAVARKLSGGGGGGGGGSSDFSTAQVTVVGGTVNCCLPYLMNDFGLEGLFVITQGYSEGSHTIALWHGACITEITTGGNLSVSGNIEDFGGGMYLITGDCTITIS